MPQRQHFRLPPLGPLVPIGSLMPSQEWAAGLCAALAQHPFGHDNSADGLVARLERDLGGGDDVPGEVEL